MQMSVFEERKKRPKGITGDSPYLPDTNSRESEKPQTNYKVRDADVYERLESGAQGMQPRYFGVKPKKLEE